MCRLATIIIAGCVAWPFIQPLNRKQDLSFETMLSKVRAALPEQAYAAPKQPRRLLIFTLTKGYRHSSIEIGAEAIKRMGEQTRAFSAEVSADIASLRSDSLRKFDAVLMLSTTGELFDDPSIRKGVLEYVAGGKGWIGIHAATDCFYEWPEYGELIGGYFDGHPWHEEVTVRIDDPAHPVCAPFEGKSFRIVDEIYQFKWPYSRSKLHVLTSLDTARTEVTKDGIHRTDSDFAVSWVRSYGKGRVFNCSLGHREEVYWNAAVLKHYLAGIQFALGDLEAETRPSALYAEGWVRAFNGKDLAGWKGLVADPPARARMTTDELSAAQSKADAMMKAHWSVEEGLLVFDGHGANLCTVKDYADFEMYVDWRIGPRGDSGIYLRGSPQVQIWDPAQWPVGSGGLYNNEKHPRDPLRVADRPIGQWNTFYIRMNGDRVTVRLNDELVVDNTVMENYWERDKPLYASGAIELQSHESQLWFREIWIRELTSGHGVE